ncbi:MAG: alpha-L-arabinofuranosidase C-terminal domain-containing protein [Candidatus Bathyarchaeia archaeon]
MVEAQINVALSEQIGTVDAKVYGHFIEHLGGVIYDGVWVGEDSKVPNIDGIRKDLVDHLRAIKAPLIRWPGGCFADRYHWQDGVGPRHLRPSRYGRWRDVAESNAFGTHEFIRLCQLTGMEPYIAANVGTGTAEEFQQWVEYCNAPAGSTTLADLRRRNGAREPFNVRYWGVGNENWSCGGGFTPEDYCTEYRRFTTWPPAFGLDLFFIACGPAGNDLDWTGRFFKKYAGYRYGRTPLHGWAPHYYCGTAGNAVEYTDDQWYELLHKGAFMEALIREQWDALGEFDPKRNVKLVVDEWATWHPSGTELNPSHLFEQACTLRDALVAALTLDIFNRHCEKVAMANIAQLVNCLQSLFLADGARFVATPNYHVYDLYKSHQNAMGVRATFEAPEVEFKVGSSGEKRKLFGLAGSASVKDGMLTLTVVNPHVEEPAEATITVLGGETLEGRGVVLTHKDIHAQNTFENPKEVTPQRTDCAARGSTFTHSFPPASVTRLDLSLKRD